MFGCQETRGGLLVISSPVVLLVDDHEDTVAMYALGLSAMGFQPITATAVDEAFERACIGQPRVIVADLSMSVLSGFDLIHRLHEDIRTRAIPIIVLTGLTLASVRQRAREAGCDRFLLKPCLPAALAGEIRDVLLTGQEMASAV
jgi:two-component system cell cycle response regulator DivK